MILTVFEYIKFAFLSLHGKLTSLLRFGDRIKDVESVASKPQNPLDRDFLEQSAWLRRAEDPRLDPSLGGRDPTKK